MVRKQEPVARGFTLIEIAIVLVVVGLILSGGLLAVAPILQSSRTSETNAKLENVEQAMLVYAIRFGCLPCPGTGNLASTSANAGWSNATTTGFYGPGGPTSQNCSGTSCAANQGVVPWLALGLSEADVTDAWGNRLSYSVTTALTTTSTSFQRTPPSTYPAGAIRVNDTAGTTQTLVAAYVVFSHGSDMSFAFGAETGIAKGDVHSQSGGGGGQDENQDNDLIFVQDDLTDVAGATHFDDIVRWRTAPIMIQLCGTNACGNPA